MNMKNITMNRLEGHKTFLLFFMGFLVPHMHPEAKCILCLLCYSSRCNTFHEIYKKIFVLNFNLLFDIFNNRYGLGHKFHWSFYHFNQIKNIFKCCIPSRRNSFFFFKEFSEKMRDFVISFKLTCSKDTTGIYIEKSFEILPCKSHCIHKFSLPDNFWRYHQQTHSIHLKWLKEGEP